MKFSRDSLPDTTGTIHDPSRSVFRATEAGAIYAIVVFLIRRVLWGRATRKADAEAQRATPLKPD